MASTRSRPRLPWLALTLLALAAAVGPAAQEAPIAFTGARILTAAGPIHDPGTLVVQHGRILAVGPANTPLPAGAINHDVAGKTLIPGLVDTHSHIGDVSYRDLAHPIQPELRVLDMVDVRDPSIRKAQAGGITTVNVMSGSGMLVSGETLYLKLRTNDMVDHLVITNRDGRPAGGLKMANGTNPRRDPPFPGSRAKSAALVRERFLAAREYRDKLARTAGQPDKRPPRDLGLETLVDVLEGRRVVHHHTHRHDDILTVLRLQQEFGFRVVLHHVTEAWKVTNELAAAHAACSLIVVDSPGGKLETRDLEWATGAALERAGVLTAFHTDDPITESRLLMRSAALAVRAGMSREAALRSLTLHGATMLDLHDRTGSLEVGKDADFVVLSGDPFSVHTRVLETWVEGRRVFDLGDPADRVFAEGGEGAGSPHDRALCCFGEGEN